MQVGAYESTTDAIKDIWRTKGILKGFYAGFGSYVCRDIPFGCIQYPLFEVLKMLSIQLIAHSQGTTVALTELPGWVLSVCGSIAGATSGFITAPLDLLKTRQMTF